MCVCGRGEGVSSLFPVGNRQQTKEYRLWPASMYLYIHTRRKIRDSTGQAVGSIGCRLGTIVGGNWLAGKGLVLKTGDYPVQTANSVGQTTDSLPGRQHTLWGRLGTIHTCVTV